MGVRRAGEQNVRNLTQNKTGSYSVTIPIEYIRELKWQQGQRVVFSLRGNKLIIEDWKK